MGQGVALLGQSLLVSPGEQCQDPGPWATPSRLAEYQLSFPEAPTGPHILSHCSSPVPGKSLRTHGHVYHGLHLASLKLVPVLAGPDHAIHACPDVTATLQHTVMASTE